MAARPDVLMSTGRSDYPNQINNVIGFPYIFRGALDTQAKAINEEMKIAAVHALSLIHIYFWVHDKRTHPSDGSYYGYPHARR